MPFTNVPNLDPTIKDVSTKITDRSLAGVQSCSNLACEYPVLTPKDAAELSLSAMLQSALQRQNASPCHSKELLIYPHISTSLPEIHRGYCYIEG